MTGKVRIGLIGAGGIAGAHVDGYRRNPETVELVAVADPVRESAEKRRGSAGVRIFADYREMIAAGGLDAVDICLPHHLHADAVIAAADAGLHVLCEKPLCLTLEEAGAITRAVERSGVTVMCAHNQLFLPAVAEAKRLIDSGALGRVYEVRTTDSFFNDFTPESMGWRARAETSGGGELIDTGYHPLYLMQHLAGGAPVEVAAMLSRHRLEFMEGEDSAQVLVRYDNGVVGHVVTSWAYEPALGTEKFSLVAERGSLSSDGITLTYRVRGEAPVTREFAPVHEFEAEVGHFADSVRNGTRPIQTHEEGIDVLGVILAAYESSLTGSIARVGAHPVGHR
ncbi:MULTISPECIES: Gfo/Idh/MocA family protein [Microbacterium]|uniref:Gfo/Idh/MocA family oxidoreductase n=1 Tax=Microbacterium wangchenii TaxID=2541726 RepID=A0ABX5SMW6_9MICO|nr:MULTISPECIES: Gfo/Idh/MocA family oxidoreductase [Microbacterium]MCK6066495.1 Gfo/Idh/MocA family oxidoreductase [Microbacterium sp. EYE_512]QBR87451.1 Gfo/Idh/MocA family oxidoreductase [Microbacterium wangchenii]TFV84439.1 Gfo/Idh/MocA family oxidoreductase [Microbacterium sp. dk485]TXK14774.1 Gfo/Idh/MocA family oxidoreductase [Microbacterium wangchenii]